MIDNTRLDDIDMHITSIVPTLSKSTNCLSGPLKPYYKVKKFTIF